MKEGVESLGRVRAQAMVLLVIAFLAGAFVGGTIERAMARPSRSSMGLGPRGGFARGGAPMARTPRAPGSLPSWYEPQPHARGRVPGQGSGFERQRNLADFQAVRSLCWSYWQVTRNTPCEQSLDLVGNFHATCCDPG